MEVLEDADAEQLLIAARWPDEPMCPACSGGARSASRVGEDRAWTTWRCLDCRKRFTVTTGTQIHSTKLTPSDWLAATSLPNPTPVSVVEAIGVSQVTARKIASILQPARNLPLSGRLGHLLGGRRRPEPSPDPWQIEQLPDTLRAHDSPLVTLSDGSKSVLNALRARPFGATPAKLAELADVSYSQTSRCLIEFERRGWAERTKAKVQHGHELRSVTLWQLSWSTGCMEALSFLRDRPTRRAEEAADRVPQRFWRSFWSGASADTLRISEHGLHIAETLIGGRDVCARAWALSALPTNVLRECRTLRGFDAGLTAELLDAELARRTAAA